MRQNASLCGNGLSPTYTNLATRLQCDWGKNTKNAVEFQMSRRVCNRVVENVQGLISRSKYYEHAVIWSQGGRDTVSFSSQISRRLIDDLFASISVEYIWQPHADMSKN